MNATITVDIAGRVVLPKPVRDELQLSAGDALKLELSNDSIILRPLRGIAGMRQKEGIWVFRTGQPVSVASVNETLRRTRAERERLAIKPEKSRHQKHRSER
jgi:AbrB family looped-hinge helix DNA binding protein